MKKKKPAAAGTWASSVTAKSISQAGIRLSCPTVFDDQSYWIEGRPAEQGRSVLVTRSANGKHVDLTPPPYDVRSRVHEYGGGAYVVTKDLCFFVNAKDQGLYSCSNGAVNEHGHGHQRQAVRQVFQQRNLRFTDLTYDLKRHRLIAVAEQHSKDSHEPENFLCSIDLNNNTMSTLHRGADFYSSPGFDRDYRRITWLTWMHPNMPWDETRLHVANCASDSHLIEQDIIVRQGESIFQPMFGPDDRLYFSSDHDNWWNLFALDRNGACTQITHEQAEIGMTQWVFGMSVYGFASAGEIIAARVSQGLWDLVSINLTDNSLRKIDQWPYTSIDQLSVTNGGFIGVFGNEYSAACIVRGRGDTAQIDVLQTTSALTLDAEWISSAQSVSFPTSDNDTAHGFYYAPKNPDFCLAEGQTPPLIVTAHGGPTTATTAGLNPRVQYWTTRGFAVLDVNYRGSSGYGRSYRQKLARQWGKYDVQDCIHGARFLTKEGLADESNVFIMGGSAGGYTVLSALAFTDFFRGGISLYGIGDLKVLTDDTHKFESRYTDCLIGPYDQALYRQRSPLYFAHDIKVPVLFFQGTEDKVVPPNQTEDMVNALKKHGVPTAYVSMIGEGHGFRRSDSIAKLMDTTLDFLCQILACSAATPASELQLYNKQNLHKL